MGESSACLMRSFSHPSSTSPESEEGDPLHGALTTSVSFGRFMSETLAWEKWSSFTQNRYLEEVEKYSKPGSVAEKKAYFEAHYKRKAAQKAAESLEQQNAAVTNITSSSLTNVIDNNSSTNMAPVQEGCCVATEQRQHEDDRTPDLHLSVDGCSTYNCGQSPLEEYKEKSNQIKESKRAIEHPTSVEKVVESSISPEYGQSPLEGCKIESYQIDGAEQTIEQPTFVENQVESSILPEHDQSPVRECITETEPMDEREQESEPSTAQKQAEPSTLLEDSQCICDQQEVRTPVQDVATKEISAFPDTKKSASLSAKLSTHRQKSRLRPPLKPTTKIQPKNGDQATSYSKRTGRESVEKKRSTVKSIHMSINFGSRVADTNKASSPVLQKIANSGLVRNLSRTIRESIKQQTPTRASTNGVSKHLSTTPQPVFGRTKKVLNQSVSENVTRERKSESLSVRSSVSSATCRPKAQCPIVSASFNLRTEERAAKRKEMLQQKLSTEAAEKEQVQTRLKGKIQNEAKNVQQSIVSQVKANPSFRPGTKPLNIQMKKVARTQSCATGTEKKQESEVLHNNSRPIWRHSVKADSFTDLLGNIQRPPTSSTKSFPQKNSMDENTSPNIQV